MDHAFTKKSRLFEQWFKSLPGASFSTDIRIADFRARNAGRGIVASVDIPKETDLLTIPRTGILSTTNSGLVTELPSFFDEIDEVEDEDEGELPLESWAKLSIALIYEHFRGDASVWKPYLDIFPHSFDTPMFWSDLELAQLQASPLRPRIGKADAEILFRTRVVPVLRKHSKVFFPEETAVPTDNELVALCHRMGTIVMSYAFDLEKDDDDDDDEEEVGEDGWIEDKDGQGLLGMVPMADILNADVEFNAHVNHMEDKLVVVSTRQIKAGEEILNYYGPRANAELLRQYGYVTRSHSRYDVMEIPWDLAESALRALLGLQTDETWKAAMAKIDEDELESSFVLERECGDVQSDGTIPGPASMPEIPPDFVEQLKVVLKALRKVDPKLVPDKRKRDELCSSAFLSCLEKLAERYPTTIKEDEEILSSGGLSHRHEMAVRVRLGEKLLLREAKVLLQSRADPSSEDDAKRTKRLKT